MEGGGTCFGGGGPVIIGSQRVDQSLLRQQGATEKETGIRDGCEEGRSSAPLENAPLRRAKREHHSPEATVPPVCRTDIRSLHSRLLHQHLAKEGSEKQKAGRTNTGCCCQPGDHDDLLSDAFPGETELCFILPQGMRVSGLEGGWRGELAFYSS